MPTRRSRSDGFIDVEIVGDAVGVEAMLLRMEAALTGPGLVQYLATIVDPYLRTRAQDRFRSEGDDVTGPWAPLSPFTQNDRAAHGYGPAHPINRRTGQMEDFIVGAPSNILVAPYGARLVYPGRRASGLLGKKVETAQRGIQGHPYTPPRPVLGVNARDLEMVLLGLAMHIESFQ